MEDFLSNKDSSDEFIGQSPVGKIVNFAIKPCRHRLYTGYKGCMIIGVSGVRHKLRIRPFSVYGESAQLMIYQLYNTFIALRCIVLYCIILYCIVQCILRSSFELY